MLHMGTVTQIEDLDVEMDKMYLDKAVMIPKQKGISYRSKGDTNYVVYEIGRKHDPDKQYTVPETVLREFPLNIFPPQAGMLDL